MSAITAGYVGEVCLMMSDPRLHAALTVCWAILAIPAILYWRDSVPFLVGVSVYANFVGHWSSYEAAKAAKEAGPNG
jgi:hypothetical protein